MNAVSNYQDESTAEPRAEPLARQAWGAFKLLVLLAVAALALMLVGCESAQAADEGETVMPAPAAGEGEAAAMAGPNEKAPVGQSDGMPGPAVNDDEHPRFETRTGARRKANHLDVIFGVQGSFQDSIDVPTATENWKVGGGGVSWLGYRRDIGDGMFSFGGRVGIKGTGLTQENTTTNLDYHHVIQSIFLMPSVRLSVPLGSHKALWFIDAGAGIGFHQFFLDEDVPNGTPKPTVNNTFSFSVLSGFMFCVYDGDARLDIGFNVDVLGNRTRVKKLYPAGTPAADKFKSFDLGHAGLDFNIAVQF